MATNPQIITSTTTTALANPRIKASKAKPSHETFSSALPFSQLVDENGLLNRSIDLPQPSWDDDLPELKSEIQNTIANNPWIDRFYAWAKGENIDLGALELHGSAPPFYLLQSLSYRKKFARAIGEPLDEKLVAGLHPPQDLDFWVQCKEGYDQEKLISWLETQGLTVFPINNGISQLVAVHASGCDFIIYHQMLNSIILTIEALSFELDRELSSCHLVSKTKNPAQPLVDRSRGIARFYANAGGARVWLRSITVTTRGCVFPDKKQIGPPPNITPDELDHSKSHHHRQPLSTLALYSNILFYAPNFDRTLLENCPHDSKSYPLVSLYHQSGPQSFHHQLAACADWIFLGYLTPPPGTSVRIPVDKSGNEMFYELRIGTLTFHLPLHNIPFPQWEYLTALKLGSGESSEAVAFAEQLLTSEDPNEVVMGGMISRNPKRVRHLFLNRLPDLLCVGTEQLSAILGEDIPCSPIKLWHYLKHNNAEEGLARLLVLERSSLEQAVVDYIHEYRSFGVDLLSRMTTVELVVRCINALPCSLYPEKESFSASIRQSGKESDLVALLKKMAALKDNQEKIFFECLARQLKIGDIIDLWDWLSSQKYNGLLERLTPLCLKRLMEACPEYIINSQEKAAQLFTQIANQIDSSADLLQLYCLCAKELRNQNLLAIAPWAKAVSPHLHQWHALEKKKQKKLIGAIFFTVKKLSESKQYDLVRTLIEATEKLQKLFECREKFMPAYCKALFIQKVPKIKKTIIAWGIKVLEDEEAKRHLLSVCHQPIKGLSEFWWETLRRWPHCPIAQLRTYTSSKICHKLKLGTIPPDIKKHAETFDYDSKRVEKDCKLLKSFPDTSQIRATFEKYIETADAHPAISALVSNWIDDKKITPDHSAVIAYWKKVISHDPIAAYAAIKKLPFIPLQLSQALIPQLLELKKGLAYAVRCFKKTRGEGHELLSLAETLFQAGLVLPNPTQGLGQCERIYADSRLHIPKSTHHLHWSLQLLGCYAAALRSKGLGDPIFSDYCAHFNAHIAAVIIRLNVPSLRSEQQEPLQDHLNAPKLWERLCHVHKRTQELLPTITFFFILLNEMKWLKDETFSTYGVTLTDYLGKTPSTDAIVALDGLSACLINKNSLTPEQTLRISVSFFENSERYEQNELSRTHALSSAEKRIHMLRHAASDFLCLLKHPKMLGTDPETNDALLSYLYELFGALSLEKVGKLDQLVIKKMKESMQAVEGDSLPADILLKAAVTSTQWDLKYLQPKYGTEAWGSILNHCKIVCLPNCFYLAGVLANSMRNPNINNELVAEVFAHATLTYPNTEALYKDPSLCLNLLPEFKDDLTRKTVIHKLIHTALIPMLESHNGNLKQLLSIEIILSHPFIREQWKPTDLFLLLLVVQAKHVVHHKTPILKHIIPQFELILSSLETITAPEARSKNAMSDYGRCKAIIDLPHFWDLLVKMTDSEGCKGLLFDLVFLVNIAQSKQLIPNTQKLHSIIIRLTSVLVKRHNLSSVQLIYLLIEIFERQGHLGKLADRISLYNNYIVNRVREIQLSKKNDTNNNIPDYLIPIIKPYVSIMPPDQRLKKDAFILSQLLMTLANPLLSHEFRHVIEENIRSLVTVDPSYKQLIQKLKRKNTRS